MSRWPDTFGDVTGEYAAAHDGAGFVGGASGLFWALGPDTITFLQNILSQDLEAMAPGRVARSFLLQPRGKLESLLWLLRADDRVGIVTEAGHREETIRTLSRWRLRVDVELQPDDREMFDVWGPAPATLDAAGGWTDEDGILVAEVRNTPLRHRLVAGLGPSDLERRGLQPIGRHVHTTLRIETGEPRYGLDVDHKTIPQESGLVPEAVSFTKGCFLGQELVARIDSRGRVNRNLRGVRMLDASAPPSGARVTYSGKVVGTLTSVGESPAAGGPVALALIRREAPPGTEVTVSWAEGTARAMVPSAYRYSLSERSGLRAGTFIDPVGGRVAFTGMLDNILVSVRSRLPSLKAREDQLRESAAGLPSPRDFAGSLAGTGLSIIAEFKRASPSKGVINAGMDPSERAVAFEAGGASAMSVLTEPDHFMGSAEDLRAARSATSLPALRKDFTLHTAQVWEARVMGADAVLLIVAILDDALLTRLLAVAEDAGLAALVEVHSKEEAIRALDAGARVVGVNNRDLRTFNVDLATSEEISPLLDGVDVRIAESGVKSPEDAARLRAAGYDALLVGGVPIQIGGSGPKPSPG